MKKIDIYLQLKIIILVSGKLQSGKNTFADLLKEEIESRYNVMVVTDYFAKLLKEMCRDSFKPLTDFLNDIFRICEEDCQDEMLRDEVKKLITKDNNWFENKNDITRHILQIVGTDIVRTVNQNFWSESFIKRVKERKEAVTINSDCRFRSEISQVESNFSNTFTIRIERDMDRNNSVNEHISEKELDDYDSWDYKVWNNGTLEELKEQAKIVATDIFKNFEIK